MPATIAGNAIEVVAGWNILTSASDDTKVIKTPLIGGDSAITAGAPITFGGGDNSTRNGETLVNGYNPADGTARFDSLSAAQISAMKRLRCEDLEIIPINDAGQMLVKKVNDKATGFPVSNFDLGPKNNAGYGTRDSNVLTFQIDEDWDEYLHFITPTDFNALTF